MVDIKQVMNDIGRCTCHVPDACRDCSYDKGHPYNECVEMMLKDTLEMLKEQQEQKEKWIRDIDLYIADAEDSAESPWVRVAKGYAVGLSWGLNIAKEIIEGKRNHG